MTTWIKVFSSMPSHPKVLMAGDRASWLAICGLCYSNEHLTDGFIARHVLPVVAPGVKRPEALADRLVAVNLWHEIEGGWQIHDYSEVQRTSGSIREQRHKDAERKAGVRELSGRSPRGQTADSTTESATCPAGVPARDTHARVEKSREEQSREETNSNASLRSAADRREIFEAWIEATDSSASSTGRRLDAKRRAVIDRALRSFPADELIDAVRGWHHSPHHCGENDRGTVYNDLSLILRDAEHIERFRDYERDPSKRPVAASRRESPSDLLRAINDPEVSS